MKIASFLFIVLVSTVLGATTIASGQLFLAIREIALNTRKEDDEKKPNYLVLETVARLNNLLGWLIIIGGILFGALTSGFVDGGYRRFPL